MEDARAAGGGHSFELVAPERGGDGAQPRTHERGDGRPDGVHEPDLGDGGELSQASWRGGNVKIDYT